MNQITRYLVLSVAVLGLSACQKTIQSYEFSRGEVVRLQEVPGLYHIPAASFADPVAMASHMQAIHGDYAKRGAGPLHLAVAAPNATQASQWAEDLTEKLAQKGFHPQALVATPIVAAEAGAVVSYRAVTVLLPDCDLPQEAQVNSGCAIERQIGLMVARPADLAGRGGVAAYDGTDSALAVGRHRTREADDRPSILSPVQTTDAGAQ